MKYEPHHKKRHLVTCIPSENLQHAHDVNIDDVTFYAHWPHIGMCICAVWSVWVPRIQGYLWWAADCTVAQAELTLHWVYLSDCALSCHEFVLASSFIITVIAPLWPAKLKPGKQMDLRLMFTKISLLICMGFETLQTFSTAHEWHIVILHIIFVTFLCFELCPFLAQILCECTGQQLHSMYMCIFEFLQPFCIGLKTHI